MVKLSSLIVIAFLWSTQGHSLGDERITVLFVGDSITAGFGIDEQNAFPAVIEGRVDSLGWPVEGINAGLSGETSSGGLRRINWLIKQKRIDVLVLELGANDGLRGIDLTLTEGNLRKMISITKEAHPDCEVIVAGMQVPSNLGQDYTDQFRLLFPRIAKDTGSHLIPFLLEDVGGVSDLNLADGKHPTAEGHKILAENVWGVLRPILERLIGLGRNHE